MLMRKTHIFNMRPLYRQEILKYNLQGRNQGNIFGKKQFECRDMPIIIKISDVFVYHDSDGSNNTDDFPMT